MNYTHEQEVPKHKKKSQKANKKSNHKHDYQREGINHLFTFGKLHANSKCYWVDVIEKCSICGKEKSKSEFLNEEEYATLKKEMGYPSP